MTERALRYEPFAVTRVRVPVRLEAELHRVLVAACGVLGVSLNEALCEAAAEWLGARCTENPELTEAVRRVLETQDSPPDSNAGPGEESGQRRTRS